MNGREEDILSKAGIFNKAEFFNRVDCKKLVSDLNSAEPYIKKKKRINIFLCICLIFCLIAYIEKKIFQELPNIEVLDVLKAILLIIFIVFGIVILFLDYLKLKPLKKLNEDLKRDIEEDNPKTIQIKITDIGVAVFFTSLYDKNKPSVTIHSINTTDGRIFYCNNLTQFPFIKYTFMAEITYYENSKIIKSARII